MLLPHTLRIVGSHTVPVCTPIRILCDWHRHNSQTFGDHGEIRTRVTQLDRLVYWTSVRRSLKLEWKPTYLTPQGCQPTNLLWTVPVVTVLVSLGGLLQIKIRAPCSGRTKTQEPVQPSLVTSSHMCPDSCYGTPSDTRRLFAGVAYIQNHSFSEPLQPTIGKPYPRGAIATLQLYKRHLGN